MYLTFSNRPGVTRRRNGDGTVSSFCNRCPLTIGCAVNAVDLAELESRHVCQPAERRHVVRVVHRTYIPTKRAGDGPAYSGLSQSAKIELIKAHLFLHPCSRCEKSAEHVSPNDERVCFRCQFSLKRRWKELASVAPRPGRSGEISRYHEVQFYSRDEFFLDSFTRFVGAALRVGDAVIVVATQPHQDTLFQRLRGEGLDVSGIIDEGRYVPLDVAETLSAFMVDDLPDPVRFQKATSAVIAGAKKAARGKVPHVAACGECAPLLWQAGNADAAVRLEALWDDVAKTDGIDILCGYSAQTFHCEQGSATLRRIVAEHSAVHAL